jgi:hypothetical protein
MAAVVRWQLMTFDTQHLQKRISSCKMVVPLSECTTLVQRSVVRFLWAKGMESKNIQGFQGLVKRWDKCLNVQGDYLEK